MTQCKFNRIDFDKAVTLAEQAARDAAIASNDRFILAMAKAVRRGREHATPGIFVDETPTPYAARRYQGEARVSLFGSPSDLCMSAPVNAIGSRGAMMK